VGEVIGAVAVATAAIAGNSPSTRQTPGTMRPGGAPLRQHR
jgi:hypothetical protein